MLGESRSERGAGSVRIGYHCSHEQFSPRHLLDLVMRAERAGFNAALSSDHFHPWSEAQGHSGYAWSFLGAAMQATALPFGVVCAPGQRYHPAVVAQKAATLQQMFPGRLWVAMGSGQQLNEGITGDRWPPKALRNLRLRESAEVARRLWAGERVTHYGMVVVEDATLYTRPERPPLLIGAALTEATAEFVGAWADGMITTSRPPELLRRMVEAFRRGGGEGKPMFLKVQVSYSRDEERALDGAWEQWRPGTLPSVASTEFRLPEMMEGAISLVRREDMTRKVRVSSDLEQHVRWIEDDLALGFTEIYLHNVNKEQEVFIDDFGRKVLPRVLGR